MRRPCTAETVPCGSPNDAGAHSRSVRAAAASLEAQDCKRTQQAEDGTAAAASADARMDPLRDSIGRSSLSRTDRLQESESASSHIPSGTETAVSRWTFVCLVLLRRLLASDGIASRPQHGRSAPHSGVEGGRGECLFRLPPQVKSAHGRVSTCIEMERLRMNRVWGLGQAFGAAVSFSCRFLLCLEGCRGPGVPQAADTALHAFSCNEASVASARRRLQGSCLQTASGKLSTPALCRRRD